MMPLHLVRVTPFIAASLFFSAAASAQTSVPDAQLRAVSGVDSTATANSDRFRVQVVKPQETAAPWTAPSPWVSMVPSNPYALRGPSFQGLQTMPFSVATAPVTVAPVPVQDPVMESRFVARRTIAGILLGLSSPFFVTGAVLFHESAALARSGPAGFFVGVGGYFLGGICIFGGVGLFIPGLVMELTDPPLPGISANRIRPKLQVGPGGASLSLSF